MGCLHGNGVRATAILARSLRKVKVLVSRLACHASLPVLKRALLVSGLATLASAGYVLVDSTTADAIPALCDGTPQTECMLGDSGWTVTIPPNVRIKLQGFDRSATGGREDIWFEKTYNVFDFSPVTLTFNPFQPERIVDSFFRMDDVVTNKTISPFNAFIFTTIGPQNDPCSRLHPDVAHIHPDGTAAPAGKPDFGGTTQWDGLLPVQGRCDGNPSHKNFGTQFLLVAGRTIAPTDVWNPQRIRLHESDQDTWSLTEQATPEPSTFALTASGLLPFAFGYLKRRERTKRLRQQG